MRRERDAAKLGARLAAGSIFVAPFVALLYRAEAGLVVMALALCAVSVLLHDAIDAAPALAKRRLRLLLGFDILLVTACLALAGWLLLRS